MAAKIYGIKNCDTMKKAFDWLRANGIAYDFHDYRAEGVDARMVRDWCSRVGWEKVLNKASTTFKELPDADKAGLDEDRAIALMLDQPSMIRRPMLDLGDRRLLGFDEKAYAEAFGR